MRAEFVGGCVGAATQKGADEARAKDYCTCVSRDLGSCVDGATEKGAPKPNAEGYCNCVSKSLEKTYTEDTFSNVRRSTRPRSTTPT